MPIASALGFDLVWFGILILFAIEISGMTPPFGLLLFTMKSVAPPGTRIYQIYHAVYPFVIIELILLILIIAVPALATTLPDLIRTK
jgi:TRAP-type mannitol/chloroaromatic compound transport system permease large subunit